MFTKVEDIAKGVAQFALPPFWRKDASRIIAAVDEYYPDVVNGEFSPHQDETGLRKAVMGASPALSEMGGRLQQLTAQGYCGIFIENLGLAQYAASDRNKLLLGLGLAMGYPTPTDHKEQRLLWDVKPRTNLPAGYVATFSEKAVSAELHTDSSFYDRPEQMFFLYVVRSAKCGGGGSLMLNARQIRQRLIDKPDGAYVVWLLSQPIFPFQTPAAFSKAGQLNAAEVHIASIFGAQTFFRFRYDMLLKGLNARPELKTSESKYALKVLLDVIEREVDVVHRWCDDDSLIIADNHVNLHGRTNFQDTERHLIRVRISDVPAKNLGRVASAGND